MAGRVRDQLVSSLAIYERQVMEWQRQVDAWGEGEEEVQVPEPAWEQVCTVPPRR